MFGIGFQEMIVILVVALVIFGPKRLPDLARSLGKGIAEFKKASEEVRKGIEDAVEEEENLTTPPKPVSPYPSPPPADAATSDSRESGLDDASSASSGAGAGPSPPGA